MKWFKNWLKVQVTESSAWIGFIGLCTTWFLSDWWTSALFLVLILLNQKQIDGWVAKYAPTLQKKIDELPED